MQQSLEVGIIGDYNPELRYHIATEEALSHGAAALDIKLSSSWIPTQSLEKGAAERILKPFHALLCSPGSPYKSMEGALAGIWFAREQKWPFLGT